MKDVEHRKLYRKIWYRKKRGTYYQRRNMVEESLPPPPLKPKPKPSQKIGKYDHLFEDL